MMHSSKNQKGEEIFTFDQYPGIEVRPDVINFNDIVEMVPAAAKFPWLVKWLMHYL